jgi:murein hydrolase activator
MFYFIKTIFNNIVFLCILLFLIIFCCFSRHSQADFIAGSIEEREKNVKNIAKQEKIIIASLNDLNFTINAIRNKIKNLKEKIEVSNKKIKEEGIKKEKLEKEIQSAKNYALSRLIALYKHNNLKTLSSLSSLDSVYDFLNISFLIQKIVEHDNEALSLFIEKYFNLNKLISELNIEREKEKKFEKKLNNHISFLSEKKELKQNMLYEIKNKKSLQIAAIDALKETEKELANKITNMPSATRTEGISKRIFSEYKGLLIMPVKGKIILKFGPYKNKNLNIASYSNGINIKTETGELVRAVFDGRVVFANWLKHYGNVLIADHGENYYTVYANIQDIFKKEGEPIEQGEVIATAGDAGSFSGSELHFEIRHYGKSVDPLNWIRI